MRLSVIGCGYLGAVHAASMAKLGHTVTGIDVDTRKIDSLAAGEAPFHEPGFTELLRSSLASGRLAFSANMADAAGHDVHFLCVGTPQAPGSPAADLRYVHAAIGALTPFLAGPDPTVVAGKSTVPVGTARALADTLRPTSPNVTLVWNPEFLREGFAVQDTLQPDRIVYGLGDGETARGGADALDRVYAHALSQGTPKIETDYETAELVKVSANSFLALKISFINGVARVCDAAGANVADLARAIGLDDRIGKKFLRSGIGFGGGCLPKDLRAFSARATELGADGLADLLDQVDRINLSQRAWVVSLVTHGVGPDLAGVPIGVLGAAFKPETDDIRDSPALAVATALATRGAAVRIYDPAAGRVLPTDEPGITVANSVESAVRDARAVLVLTEWDEFVPLDPTDLADLTTGRLIIDGRGALDPARWRDAGWDYRGLGTR
ncbi:MAG: UDP-glucose/GDP-mannose dehydrogenase family protein [Bifidobacteriaceae bacterium]|nr:UDP-glucose/GDP-mannose dehydrogenase family protein [Bifidobacteriaceae bacterium]